MTPIHHATTNHAVNTGIFYVTMVTSWLLSTKMEQFEDNYEILKTMLMRSALLADNPPTFVFSNDKCETKLLFSAKQFSFGIDLLFSTKQMRVVKGSVSRFGAWHAYQLYLFKKYHSHVLLDTLVITYYNYSKKNDEWPKLTTHFNGLHREYRHLNTRISYQNKSFGPTLYSGNLFCIDIVGVIRWNFYEFWSFVVFLWVIIVCDY